MIIWRIFDGKPGHDKQSGGLVDALLKITSGKCLDFQALNFRRAFINFLLGSFPPGSHQQKPELIIGAGHGTHLSILCAQRAYGGKSVVIMNPSMPTAWFDFCLIPDHDEPEVKNNIIVTRGALHTVTPSCSHDEGKGLFMIGGPSKHYNWDNESLLKQVTDIIKQAPDKSWEITDSPRTPGITSSALKRLATNLNVGFYPHKQTGHEWLHEQLQKAGYVWVTADSVSMIYEALGSGAATGVLSVPGKTDDKITGIVNSLAGDNMITTYDDWNQGKTLMMNEHYINEAGRCAEELLSKLKSRININ
jgi:uncharacterized protein